MNPNSFSWQPEDEEDKSKHEKNELLDEDDDDEEEKPVVSLSNIFKSQAKKGEGFLASIFKEDKPTDPTEDKSSKTILPELATSESSADLDTNTTEHTYDRSASIEEPIVESIEDADTAQSDFEVIEPKIDKSTNQDNKIESDNNLPENNASLEPEEINLPKTLEVAKDKKIEEPIIEGIREDLVDIEVDDQKTQIDGTKDNINKIETSKIPNVPPPITESTLQNIYENYAAKSAANAEIPTKNYNNQPVNSAKNQEKVVERVSGGGALLAFLGADLLSRRRDRKINREVRNQVSSIRNHIDHLNNPQLSKTETIDRLEENQSAKLAGVYQKTAEQIRKEAALSIKQEIKQADKDKNEKPPLSSQKPNQKELSNTDLDNKNNDLSQSAVSIGEILATPAFINSKQKEESIDKKSSQQQHIEMLETSTHRSADKDKTAIKYSRQAETISNQDSDNQNRLSNEKNFEIIDRKNHELVDKEAAKKQSSAAVSLQPDGSVDQLDKDKIVEQHINETQNILPKSDNSSLNYTQPILFGMAMAIFILIFSMIAYLMTR